MGQKLPLVLTSVFLCWTHGEGLLMDHYTSTYDVLCVDDCKTHGDDFYWCNTRDGWDYCSPVEGRDYEGHECKDDHSCEKHGQSYYWCYRKSGGWGYCGKVEPKLLLHMSSTYQSMCRDECLYDENSNYYWCHTDKGWDYCSPLPGVTYKNELCRSDHPCDTHDNSYTWCKTGWITSWDYCGVIKPNECGYDASSRKRRQPNNPQLICSKPNKCNKIKTQFYAESAPNAIADVSNNRRNEIENLISRWNNGYLGNQARSQLITSDNFRVDLQGFANRNNQRYYNLQIQMNVPRRPGTSTTVSQVLVPQNERIPDRYVRRAFTESFLRRARIFVDVIHGDYTISHGQNCG